MQFRGKPKINQETYDEVMERAGYRCENEECRTPSYIRKLEVDHILERRFGGRHGADNLRVLCVKCHVERHGGVYREEIEKIDWEDQRAVWEMERRAKWRNIQHKIEGGYMGYGDRKCGSNSTPICYRLCHYCRFG